MKRHADNKRYVKPSTLTEGDTVLVKRDDSKKKSDTPYDPRPRVLVEKKGSMIKAEAADGNTVTRNSSFFKSAPPVDEETSTEEGAALGEEELKDATDGDDSAQTYASPRRYPERARMRPVRLDDYVCT